MRNCFFLILIFYLAACTHPRVIPLAQSGVVRYPPKNPALVGVFRSVMPFERYEEMGLITVSLASGKIDDIYQGLRQSAADFGADAVVGVKVDERFHAEARTKEVCAPQQTCVPQTKCASEGNDCATESVCVSTPVCTTVREPPNTTTYLGIGTMIRRVE